MTSCDVCGSAAKFLIQYRPNPRSEYPYCAGHARPIIERHNRDQHLHRLRLVR